MTTEFKEFELALSKAKIALMTRKNSAFFTALAFSLRHKPNPQIPTACTDGKTVWYNPTAYLALHPDQRVSRMVHETLHVALQHMGRLESKVMWIWNYACDYVINQMLVDRGFMKIDTWLLDERFRGMSSEQVYKILLTELQHEPEPQDFDCDLQNPPMDLPDVEFQQHVQQMLVRAQIRSKQEGDSPGTIPGDLEILLNKILQPKLPWRVILRRYIQGLAKNDYSWRRPNRRYFPDLYAPALYSERVVDLTVAVDTSGSVSDSDFERMVSEIGGIFRLMPPKRMTLVQFDTRVHTVTQLRNLSELRQCKFKGRGGTAIGPVLRWCRDNRPQLLLVLTDGEFDWPYDLKNAPRTIWLIHNNSKFRAPFGKVIHYEID